MKNSFMGSTQHNIYNISHFLKVIYFARVWALITLALFSLTSCGGSLPETRSADSSYNEDEHLSSAFFPELNLFFFNNDALQRLVSYNHIPSWDGSILLNIGSTHGYKTLAAVCSPPSDIKWEEIYSYAQLQNIRSKLSDETPQNAIKTGLKGVDCQYISKDDMGLTPLLCRVVLRSIQCDFSGREYANEKLRNVSVFLSCVNAETGLFEDSVPTQWLNQGGLNESDMEAMNCPEMLLWKPDNLDIGNEVVNLDHAFYCYANPFCEETLGSLMTKIVIEGEIEGKKYYYPIAIPGNRLIRGCSVDIDIVIRKTGTSTPEILAESAVYVIWEGISSWEEEEERIIYF